MRYEAEKFRNPDVKKDKKQQFKAGGLPYGRPFAHLTNSVEKTFHG